MHKITKARQEYLNARATLLKQRIESDMDELTMSDLTLVHDFKIAPVYLASYRKTIATQLKRNVRELTNIEIELAECPVAT